MTRINLIPPKFLLDQHLMAEFREFPMVLAALRKSRASPNWYKIEPAEEYLLNKGHVIFFYNKRDFLKSRYDLLVDELYSRYYELNDPYKRMNWSIYDELPRFYCEDWKPTSEDVNVSLKRILQRVSQRPSWYKYKGETCTYQEYKRKLTKAGILEKANV